MFYNIEFCLCSISNKYTLNFTTTGSYVGIINFIFGVLFDILHSFISVIPSYKMFVYHNSSLSSMAVIALLAIISNFILITLIKKIVQMLKKD